MSYEFKVCNTCKIEKSILDFSICSAKNALTIYYRAICKECRKPKRYKANQKYYDENNAKIKLYELKKYHNGGKEIRKEYNKNYHANYRKIPENKQKLNQKSNDWQKKKRKNDPSFSVRQSVSRAINARFKLYGSVKNRQSFLQFVSWTIEELKQHLEKQFEYWMSWDNRGNYIKSQWNDMDIKTWKWNLDHIIPQSDLPYTSMEDDNFKKCWALENLRPYSAKQNLLDGVNKYRHGEINVI